VYSSHSSETASTSNLVTSFVLVDFRLRSPDAEVAILEGIYTGVRGGGGGGARYGGDGRRGNIFQVMFASSIALCASCLMQ
jgi:hypothetical protein